MYIQDATKPKKYANKVGMVLAQEVNIGPKIKQNALQKYSSLSFILQWCKYLCRVI